MLAVHPREVAEAKTAVVATAKALADSGEIVNATGDAERELIF